MTAISLHSSFKMMSLLGKLPGFSRMLARQLRRPQGAGGRYVVRWMNEVNQRMNAATVHHLDVRPTDRVLEIGFGGGVALHALVQRVYRGKVMGLELSGAALDHAAETYADFIELGRLQLVQGDLDQLRLNTEPFDKVISVNTIYFVQDIAEWIRQVWCAMSPGGRFVLSFRPPEEMKKLRCTQYGFDLRDQETIGAMLRDSGFGPIRFHRLHDGHLGFVCGVADKPAADAVCSTSSVVRSLVVG